MKGQASCGTLQVGSFSDSTRTVSRWSSRDPRLLRADPKINTKNLAHRGFRCSENWNIDLISTLIMKEEFLWRILCASRADKSGDLQIPLCHYHLHLQSARATFDYLLKNGSVPCSFQMSGFQEGSSWISAGMVVSKLMIMWFVSVMSQTL